MDASSQTLVLARRISGIGGTHMLKKVKLLLNTNKNKQKYSFQHIRVSEFVTFHMYNWFKISVATGQLDVSSAK